MSIGTGYLSIPTLSGSARYCVVNMHSDQAQANSLAPIQWVYVRVLQDVQGVEDEPKIPDSESELT